MHPRIFLLLSPFPSSWMRINYHFKFQGDSLPFWSPCFCVGDGGREIEKGFNYHGENGDNRTPTSSIVALMNCKLQLGKAQDVRKLASRHRAVLLKWTSPGWRSRTNSYYIDRWLWHIFKLLWGHLMTPTEG